MARFLPSPAHSTFTRTHTHPHTTHTTHTLTNRILWACPFFPNYSAMGLFVADPFGAVVQIPSPRPHAPPPTHSWAPDTPRFRSCPLPPIPCSLGSCTPHILLPWRCCLSPHTQLFTTMYIRTTPPHILHRALPTLLNAHTLLLPPADYRALFYALRPHACHRAHAAPHAARTHTAHIPCHHTHRAHASPPFAPPSRARTFARVACRCRATRPPFARTCLFTRPHRLPGDRRSHAHYLPQRTGPTRLPPPSSHPTLLTQLLPHTGPALALATPGNVCTTHTHHLPGSWAAAAAPALHGPITDWLCPLCHYPITVYCLPLLFYLVPVGALCILLVTHMPNLNPSPVLVPLQLLHYLPLHPPGEDGPILPCTPPHFCAHMPSYAPIGTTCCTTPFPHAGRACPGPPA